MLENIIAYHCGPALAGIKPANIAACQKKHIPDIHAQLEQLNSQLNKRDIYIEAIAECQSRVLIFVYRKKVLEEHLKKPEMSNFLKDFGYPEKASAAGYIAFLKLKLVNDSFPHEIGVFLGYPLHDIYGFINHRDEGCLLIGEWKVYHDAETAKKLFLRYKSCRKAILKRILNGFTLAQIFCAA